jgi:hypothetical protein
LASSFRRRPESSPAFRGILNLFWTPAFAGVTV